MKLPALVLVLQAGLPPSAVPEDLPPRAPRWETERRGKGLMIAGWSTFAAAHLIAAGVGFGFLVDRGPDGYRGGGDPATFGVAMTVPLVGPWIAIPHDPEAFPAGPVALGLGQLVGLTLALVGTVRWERSGRHSPKERPALRLGSSGSSLLLAGSF